MKQMKSNFRKLFFSFALIAIGTSAFAQLPMTRSIFNGAYTAIVGGTTSTATGDDAYQQNIPVGFSFNYLGTPYTQFSVSTNGWISFANGATFDAFSPDLYSTTTNGTLAPWWDDLTTSAIVYQTTGTPGTQVCTIQWTSLSYYFTSTRTINFQVKLYEGTNVIEFWYGTAPTGTLNTAESASIGIKSTTGGNGQYLDAVTGSAFTGNSDLQSDRWPAYNFRFTPGAPTAIAGGTYNVGVGQTYINLNEAVANINHCGISGPVILNLVDAQYDVTAANGSNFFPIILGPIAGASAVNTTTITKVGTAAILLYGGASGANGAIANQASTTALASNLDPIIGLVGADYVTLNNLDLRGNTGNNLTDHGVGVYNSSATDGATNNTISNVTVTMNRANTGSRGFLQNVITTPTSALGANSNNTYKDFSIKSVYAGIQLIGNATYPDLNTQITRTTCGTFNSIGDPSTANDIGNGATATYGISATNQSGFTIANNNIRNVTNTGGQADGIIIVTFQGTCTLNNNKIQTIRNAGTASTTGISGIRLSHTTAGSHTIRVYNNTVSEITSGYTGAASTARTLKGIFVSGAGGTNTQSYEIYNNSVSMDGSASLNVSSSCLEVNSAAGPIYKVGNNVFANFTGAQGATSKHYIFSTPTALTFGPAGTVSDNNDIFIANDAGTSGFTGFDGTTNYNTLANWSAAITPAGLESASLNLNPNFINNQSDLHPSNLLLNAAGQVPPVYVTVDNDCASRTPDNDIGAYILNACSGMPTAGTITGATSVCAGSGTTLTLTGASSGAGITYQWASSLVNGGPYTTLLGTSTTQATGPITVPTYFVVGVGCSVSGLAAVTSQFAILVNPLPTVAVTPTSGSICLPGGSPIALSASGAVTYTWLPTAGLTPTTGANVSANPAATTTYTVTGTDATGCVNTATTTITVGENPSVSQVTATPASICSGGNSQLLANGGTTSSYTVSAITYAPIATPGSGVTTLANAGVAVTPLSSGTLDDGGWMNQAIPFSFMYFGASYSSFAVSTNGFIFLGAGAPNTYTGYSNAFPSTIAARPSIGAMYSDLDFRTVGTVNYFISGTAPYRKLVINWSNGNFYSAVGSLNTQMIIYETSNIIEVHTTSSTGTNTAVEGIQNAAGTLAYPVAGRNNVTWAVAVADAYRWSPAGGVTYSWSPATFLSSTTINNPMANAVTATTTYTVTVANGACASTGTVTLTAGSPLTSSASASPSTTVCQGSNITLNATPIGGGAPFTYSWVGPNSFTSTNQNPTISGITAAGAGTYTVTINDGCAAVSTATVTVSVNPLPSVAVTPTAGLICLPGGSPVALAASGATTYAWGPAAGLSATTGANVTANPGSTTTYTVSGTDGNGCVNTATAAITVGVAVTMDSVTATPANICSNGNSVLNAYASLATQTYCQPTYSTGTGFGDYCSSVVLNTLNNSTVGSTTPFYTLYPSSGSTTTTLVAGNTYTVTLVAGTYTINDLAAWIDYNKNGILNDGGEKLGETDNLGATPSSTSFTFTVPLTAINGTTRFRVREMDHSGTNDMDPCNPQSVYGETEDYTITITGGVNPATFAWSPATFLSSTTGSPVNATAVTSTTTYTTTATTVAGCTATGTVTLTVAPPMTATSSATPGTTNCVGTNVTMTATPTGGVGPYTFAWTGPNSFTSSSQNANIPSVVAANNGTYTCVITDNCSSTTTVTITLTINNLPIVNISGANSFCVGDSTLLTGSSGGTSQWYLNGVAIVGANTNTYYATTAGVYNMTKTNLNGCVDSAAVGVTVVVNALPSVTANATSTTVCSGSNITFTGSGAATYVWSGGVTDAVPAAITTGGYYVVTGTDGNGCANMDSVLINVNALPVVTLGADVVQCGGTVLLDAGNTGSTYLWSETSTTQTITVSTSGTYYVDVTDVNGCSGNDTVMITINPLPVVALGADTTQCGGSVMLDAANAGSTYLWSDASTAQTLTVNTSGTYSVVVTDVNGCTGNDAIDVTINAVPVVALGNDTSFCSGTVTLDAMNTGDSYLWSDNSLLQTLVVTTSGTYWVDVTNSFGCTTRDSIVVTVTGAPVVALGSDITACGSATLDAGNAGSTYLWSDASTAQTLTVTTSGTYYVDVTSPIGCLGSDTINVTINALPVVTFSVTQSMICVDDAPLSLSGSPVGGTFSGSFLVGSTFDPSTATAGSYPIVYTFTDVNGCTATVTDSITVSDCVGVHGNGTDTEENIYPNPNAGQFTIELGYVPSSAVTVEIMDELGQKVKSFNMTTTSEQVDLTTFASSVYMVKITNGNSVHVYRVVSNK